MTDETNLSKAERPPLRILVVEDSAFIRKIFLNLFESEHAIALAPNVKEGWKLYLKTRPNIAFLDISLPDGTGHDLAHRIKNHNPQTFVIMATGNDYSADREEAAFNRTDGFITKPFDRKKIGEAIDRYWTLRTKR